MTFLRLIRRYTTPPNGKLLVSRTSSTSLWGKWLFFYLSLGAAALAIVLAGYDKVILALYQYLALGQVDVSVLEARLSLASGEEGWIAPGYIKQLRDVLLPLAALILLFTVKRSTASFVILLLFVVMAVSLMMLSTGQRGPSFLFLIATVYCLRYLVRWELQSKTMSLILGLAIVFFAFGTFYTVTSTFTSRVIFEDFSTLEVLVDRVVTRIPEENVLGANAWLSGAPFPGAGWLIDLSSVLPGTQVGLSTLIHEYLGGGSQGNSVLGTWIDVYYNFGWLLGIAVAQLLAIALGLFNHWVSHVRTLCPVNEVCALWLSLCMLHVMAPFGFLLYGPFALSAVLLATALWIRVLRPYVSRVLAPSLRFRHLATSGT